MQSRFNRRNFLSATVATGMGLATGSRLQAVPWKTTLHKGLMGRPTEKVLQIWKAAGIEGYQTGHWQLTPQQAAAARKLAESLDMKINSVVYGWDNFNHGDEALAAGVAKIESALRAAEAYGADDLLIVPCRVGGKGSSMAIPQPADFDIRFDAKTGHLKQAVADDNAKYAEYIAAYNQAVDASRVAIEKLIPTAEKTRVIIALENAGNNLWVKPDCFANFIDSFQSPWVKVYFDVPNNIRYAPPEEWIATLGKLIVDCHVKDVKLNGDGSGEKVCNLREGIVDWPAVRRAFDQVGYNGWLTVEGGNLSPEEASKRLDLIIAGK
jgi:L-ribulose-5-phosphate 3-epimerase